MTKTIVIASLLILATLGLARAQIWLIAPNGAPQVNSGGSSGPPPTCSNELDFSVACNSQYLALGAL